MADEPERRRTPPPRRPAPLQMTPSTPGPPSTPSTTANLTSTPRNPPPALGSQSCLPRPLFREEPLTLSTKKERQRRGDLFRPPPRPPPRSCPPKSRVFLHRESDLLKAQLVSFEAGRGSATGTPLQSKAYQPGTDTSYFEQAFLKEAEIGVGCFGNVYRVRSKDDHQLYAVKIARERYRGPTDRARKLEEVRKHQFLPPHTNLVRFYNSWEERGRLYQQFELCASTLEELGDRQREIPQATIWAYMVDLLQAVGHLHDHDHIHMDIKPENIFIGMDGICKLGDFGLMIDLAAAEGQGIEGDPKYLAPEALQGCYTKACDVFSLGVTLLELACDLELPRGGELWHELRRAGPAPGHTLHLQPELRRVLQLMMTRDEARRPSVRQLMELPSVRRAVRRRARQLLLARCWRAAGQAFSVALPLLHLLLELLLLLLRPLLGLLPATAAPPATPPPLSPAQAQRTAAAAMDAFSDDEPDVTTGSSQDSELAAPLQQDGCGSGPGTPRRRASSRTPPSSGRRNRTAARTPGGAGTPGKRLFFASPAGLDSSSLRSLEDVFLSPHSSEQATDDARHSDSESDPELAIRPQCLANTFDAFSDDDF